MEFLEYLAQEVEKTGHVVKRGDSSILVETINLKIETSVDDKKEHNVNAEYSVVYQITIKAIHEQLFPEGIYDCLAGLGGSENEAFEYAAQNWVWSVFILIHEILVPVETKDFNVPRLNLITRNLDTGEDFGWKLFLGELQLSGEFVNGKEKFEQIILVKKLLGEISAIAIEKRLFWIKIYVGKVVEETMVDCWLNNADWVEGLNLMHQFAKGLDNHNSYAAMKQFIILKPCEISEIKNADELRKSLPPASKPGFFSRLFGKR